MKKNKGIVEGATVSISREVMGRDVEVFADLSLDRNAIHFDDDFAAKSIFHKRIAHGMIGASLISGALTKLMGHGNIWLSLSLRFEKPIFINDQLTCVLIVKEVNRRGEATIEVNVIDQNEETKISGSVQSMRFLRE